ncbi:MAG: hypothetical protein ACK4ZM_01385, partial [bacterium]
LLQLTEWTRVNSTFAGHYDLAAFLVMILPILVGFITGVQDKKEKILAFLLGVFAFYILLLTSSIVFLAIICAFWLPSIKILNKSFLFFSSCSLFFLISYRYILNFSPSSFLQSVHPIIAFLQSFSIHI